MRFDGEHEGGNADEDEDMDSEGGASGSGEDEDEEEWAGVNGASGEPVDEDEKRNGTKPKKPPTGEELRNIKDATELYRSSSFKLQVRSWSLLRPWLDN